MSRESHTDFTRIFDIVEYQVKKYPQKKALNYFSGGEWRSLSIHEVVDRSYYLASHLIQKGLKKGDKLIIIPQSGLVDWVCIDMACQYIGVILVPLHYTISTDEFQLIIKETEAKICITVDTSLFYKFRAVSIEENMEIFHTNRAEGGYFRPFTDKIPRTMDNSQIDQIKKSILPEDIATIMYTSGTSELSKGVVLTHRNIVSNIKSILTILPLKDGDRVLSFLPFSHIFERVAFYVYLTFGANVYFCQSREAMVHDFRTVKPIFFTSVPRVLEKMYGYLQEKAIGQRPFRREIIQWAVRIGKKYDANIKNPIYLMKLWVARLLVFQWWKKRLGGKIKYIAVGAAALHPDIARLFTAAGIQVVSGYGMTETSPIITVNRFSPGMNQFGTVGIPVPGVDVLIDTQNENGEGEILVRGPNVTQGYFKRPELTKKAFTSDGWLKTGDIGKLNEKKFLVITDRNKDLFKTTSGKFISPQSLENQLNSSAYIAQAMVVGFNKPFAGAIIIPDMDMLKAWCVEKDIHWTESRFMVHNIKVIAKIQEEIDLINEYLPNYQRIKGFVIDCEEWTPENQLLTASYKPRREKITSKLEKEISGLYGL